MDSKVLHISLPDFTHKNRKTCCGKPCKTTNWCSPQNIDYRLHNDIACEKCENSEEYGLWLLAHFEELPPTVVRFAGTTGKILFPTMEDIIESVKVTLEIK